MLSPSDHGHFRSSSSSCLYLLVAYDRVQKRTHLGVDFGRILGVNMTILALMTHHSCTGKLLFLNDFTSTTMMNHNC